MSFKITHCQAEFHLKDELPYAKIGIKDYETLGNVFRDYPHWLDSENKRPAAELINFMLFGEKYRIYKVNTFKEELETFCYLKRMFEVRKIEKGSKVLFIYLKDQNQLNSKIVFTYSPSTKKTCCIQKCLDT